MGLVGFGEPGHNNTIGRVLPYHCDSNATITIHISMPAQKMIVLGHPIKCQKIFFKVDIL